MHGFESHMVRMDIVIKNLRSDNRSENSLGYDCGRFIHHRSIELELEYVNLGNQHKVGFCDTCNQYHTRASLIPACRSDLIWQEKVDLFVDKVKRDVILQEPHTIELWCWCAPLPCHCDIIKERLEKEMGS